MCFYSFSYNVFLLIECVFSHSPSQREEGLEHCVHSACVCVVCAHACARIRMRVCLSVCPFVCLSACLSVCDLCICLFSLSVSLSLSLSPSLSLPRSLSLALSPSLSLPLCLCTHAQTLKPCVAYCQGLSCRSCLLQVSVYCK